mgnify:FL=1
MSIHQLRNSLIKDIEQANEAELKHLLKLYQIVQKQQKNSLDWNILTEQHKSKITIGLQQLKEGRSYPVEKVVAKLNKKYGVA